MFNEFKLPAYYIKHDLFIYIYMYSFLKFIFLFTSFYKALVKTWCIPARFGSLD